VLISTSLSDCVIRSWCADDERSLVENANNRKVWRNLVDAFPHPYTAADARDWIRTAATADPEVHFAIARAGVAIGGVGVLLHSGELSRTGTLGYWLGERFWGLGIAAAVVAAFAPYASARFALVRLEARVFAWNPASARVLEKCGFAREALLRDRIFKDGQIVGEYVYARTGRG
jgi:RimJ/RimL family protein N-acetyltransferase